MMSSSVEKYLSGLVKVEPRFEGIRELYTGKKWHQLTEELLSLISSSDVSGVNLVELYESFIQEFESNLNPLALVRILCGIARRQLKGISSSSS